MKSMVTPLSRKEAEEGIVEVQGSSKEVGVSRRRDVKTIAGGEHCVTEKLVCLLVSRMWKLVQVFMLSETRGKFELVDERRGK